MSKNGDKNPSEESYFDKLNRQAVEALKSKTSDSPPSPVSGEPMERVEIDGTIVYRCSQSGGLWIEDAAELEKSERLQDLIEKLHI